MLSNWDKSEWPWPTVWIQVDPDSKLQCGNSSVMFHSYRRKTSRKSRRFDTAVAPGGRQLTAGLGNSCWSCQVLSAEQSWKLSMFADPRKLPIRRPGSQTWWYMPILPELRRQKQKGPESSRPAWSALQILGCVVSNRRRGWDSKVSPIHCGSNFATFPPHSPGSSN